MVHDEVRLVVFLCDVLPTPKGVQENRPPFGKGCRVWTEKGSHRDVAGSVYG